MASSSMRSWEEYSVDFRWPTIAPPSGGFQGSLAGNVSNQTSGSRDEGLAKVEIGVQAFIFCLALVGNSCVLLALRYRKKKTSRMHLFIMHLSVADLLVAFCNILPQLAWDVTYRFQGPDWLCRVVKYLQVMVMYLSTYVLIMTAIDRYRAICHPLSNYTWSSRRAHVMIATSWALALLLSIPQLIIFRLQEVSEGVYDCWAYFGPEWTMKAYITSFMLSVYILPFLVLVVLYGRICFEVWKNAHGKRTSPADPGGNGKIVYKFNGTGTISIISPNNSNSHDQDLLASSQHHLNDSRNPRDVHHLNYRDVPRSVPVNYCSCQCHQQQAHHQSRHSSNLPRVHHIQRGLSRSKMKTIKLTFVVILAYIVCWSPFFITQMWWAYDERAPYNNSTFVICLLLASLNSCCNPWIYMAFSTNFIQSVLPCCRSRMRPPTYHHQRVCSVADRQSSSKSDSLTSDENNPNRKEKHLIESRKHGTASTRMDTTLSRTSSGKCAKCAAAAGIVTSPSNSWKWKCNLFPSAYKARGNFYPYTYRQACGGQPPRPEDLEQCKPLHQIKEERLSDKFENLKQGVDRNAYPDRYYQCTRSRKSLSHPSLFSSKPFNYEKVELRCTSV